MLTNVSMQISVRRSGGHQEQSEGDGHCTIVKGERLRYFRISLLAQVLDRSHNS